jgi:ribosomal protein L11 methyltransferase
LKFTATVASESDAIFVTKLLDQIALAISWQHDSSNKAWEIEILFESKNIYSIKQFIEFAKETLKISILNSKIENLEPRDWLRENQESFPPIEIGQFYIYGSHIMSPTPGTSFPLKIDAATAFGSGNHGSTKGCLQALSELQDVIQPYTVLDVGCGSGILAMAAAHLWLSSNIIASDIDPECIRVTLENCKLNKLSHIQVIESNGFQSSIIQANKPYNLIIANILATVLKDIADDIDNALSQDGFVILSGILNTQKEAVLAKYQSIGFILHSFFHQDDWVTLIMKK